MSKIDKLEIPVRFEQPIPGGRIKAVWAVYCEACNTWLDEWNSSRIEAEVILREHQDELHD